MIIMMMLLTSFFLLRETTFNDRAMISSPIFRFFGHSNTSRGKKEEEGRTFRLASSPSQPVGIFDGQDGVGGR